MKVKICGITNLGDAQAALEVGADLLGFNFYPTSPRFIQPKECARILDVLERGGLRTDRVTMVGVFVNATLAEVRGVLDACDLDLAQLSGDEPPEMLSALSERAFKALRPADTSALERSLALYPRRSAPPAWLVDAYRPGAFGGTGQVADWSLAAGLAARAPIFLAGGLTPENVGAAARQVRPWGVDVASGVESAPGRKDREKMIAFIRAARGVLDV
jgi:phosphoribosylanthranilate isomerase